MTAGSGYVLETLREGAEFTLYRGRQHGNPLPLLAVSPAAEQPSPQSLRRLEHEYLLAADLDPAWAARPLALTRHEGRAVLILKDPGGELLDRVLDRGRGQPLELTRFLRVAIGLAAALGQVHRHGLIHKDIKPPNVLVDDAGNVRLTGFGIASRLPQESQAPAPPEVIAGTLAYMAPEQTGRMNRSIDARSDLYSLGVTLYQMLTGTLPFAAADPLEWVHCHIARQPTPPGERAKVPGPLSAIVMKLLAKNAEERYQTASGLGSDLRCCLAQWETHGRIDEFPLGAHDASDQFRVPEKLYGREREIDALLAAFDRVVAGGTPELVLVSGYSGVGKSSVVNELHKALVLPRGLFAAGKLDQYKRDIPYTTLAQAFQTLVRQILAKDEAEVAQWRNALSEAVGPNGQLMVGLIPEVEFVIGKQPPVAELPPQDAQNRFQMVFRRFLGAFARPEHPLALFLDDLQWLDAATLEVLEHLITDPDVRNVLLIGAYRDNEVSPSHPLMRTLAAVRKTGARVQEIVLAPLGLEDLGRLASDALHCEPARAQSLTQLVHEKTAGNPFFAIQFLMALAEEGLLAFDAGAATWTWDLARIHAKRYTDNVVELMVGKLKRLPVTTQDALKQLSCLGNVAEIATLALVHAGPEEVIHSALWEAIRVGLILRFEDRYAFLHDRVQEAAYALIPEGERAAAHLRIGRMLASRTAPGELEEHIFEVVNQLNRGAALITAQEEREHLAELNLMAGKRAKASTAYASALNYLTTGAALLGEDLWERRHELTFALELNRAECEFLTGELAAAEDRLSRLSRRASGLADLASVTCLRVELYTTLDRSDRAVEVGLEYLRRIGIQWSPHPSNDDVVQEYERIWRQLESRSIEELIDLPKVADPDWRATLDVLAIVISPAMFTDEILRNLIVGRITNLSLEHGNSDGSCFAYVWLGMILGPRFGDYRAGFRFGRLGYELVEKRGLHRYQARTYVAFGNLVIPWTKHLRSGRDLVRRAFDAAINTGDLTYAAYCCNNLNTNLLATGDPLGDVQREAENGLEFARRARFGIVIDIITSQLGLIRTLRGGTPEFGSFNDGEVDELRFEHHLQGESRLALPECWYWIRKLQARVYSADYVSAIKAASKAQALLWTSTSFFETAEYHFYGALARAAHHDEASADERPRHLEALSAHHKQLNVWAENCPENFADRATLVAAEIARIEGRPFDAMCLYEEAIRSARANDFVHNEALANELAGRFYAARGFQKIANVHLRDARYCYLRWGADGKVRQLDQAYSHLREPGPAAGSSSTIGAPIENLDLATVIKVSQAVSGEIVLETLIDTLMRTALEHAGAQRGLLILAHGGATRVEAEATTNGTTITVQSRRASVAAADLPDSVLQYVVRTRESVVLDDASAQNAFSADEYIHRNHVRSLLCLPLVRQTALVGVLYLENNLTPSVFTPSRSAVLKLIASQAAISLENAYLYTDLQQENSDRRRAEDSLRRSETYLAEAQTLSHTGSFGWNAATGEIYWSAETFRIFEFDPANPPDVARIAQQTHPEDRTLVEQELDRARREKKDFDLQHRLLMPDGSIKHLKVVARALAHESGDLEFVGAVMDVTEHTRAEAALKQGQKRFRAMVEKSAEGIVLGTPEKGVIYASPSVEQVLGYRPDEFAGRSLYRVVHPDHRQRIADTVAALLADQNNVVIDEVMLLHKDRSWRSIECTMRNLLHEPSVQALVVNFRDITERKHAQDEREQLEQRLRQAEKMEAVGRLAAGIAHDFNNVLAGVFAYGEMLFDETPEHSPLKRYAKNVLTGATRGRALVEQILAYSRSQLGKRAPIDIGPVVAETLELLRGSLPAGIRLQASTPQLPLVVIGDATQLHQVVMNLCTNAIQATNAGGTLRVALEAVDLPAERALSNGTLRPGHYVRLTVEDNGSGMDAATLSRIFEPFFTTKEIGRGTGLGLSLVYAIITDAGGAIDVHSILDQGSTFSIYLPRAQGALVTAEAAEIPLPRGNGERVLLVDDDANVLAMTAEVLSRLGYEPVSFSDSHAALAAFEAAPRSFDVVVTDDVIPGLTGTGLASALRLQRRELPILLVSGYSGPILAQRALAAGVSELLVKPLQSRDIAAALARVLHAAQ
jgi:PAS domain S-box-containing protein